MEVKLGVFDFLESDEDGLSCHSLFFKPLDDIDSVHVVDLMLLIQCINFMCKPFDVNMVNILMRLEIDVFQTFLFLLDFVFDAIYEILRNFGG